jgi:hypothetical protein
VPWVLTIAIGLGLFCVVTTENKQLREQLLNFHLERSDLNVVA